MALEESLEEITSADRVFDSPDVLETYSHDNSFVPKIRPRCVVKASTMEEVREIIKLANDLNVPLVPVSSKGPHHRGGTVPGAGGAVIVDLNEMNRIIRIDPRNKVAMIEPGVTFGQLKEGLARESLAPYMTLAPDSNKSVLTSYLEREPITIPRDQWESQDPLLCLEVVYGTGDLFRTGSAAGPGTPEEQWEVGRAMVRGWGPANTDFTKLVQAAQGTMGIITWGTVKCKRLPDFTKTYFVPSNDPGPIMDLVYRTMWRRVGNQVLILNNHNLASLLSDDEKEVEVLRGQLPSWILLFSIEGTGLMPEERVAWHEKALLAEAQKVGIQPVSMLAGITSESVAEALSGPSTTPYWKIKKKGGNHDIFFLTKLDQAGQFVDELRTLAMSIGYPVEDIGIYLQPTIQGTNCHCEFNLPYDPRNGKERDRVKILDQKASRIFANMGGFFSRPYGYWADVVYSRDSASTNALRKVKNIFDPNGIMNPGKLCF